MSSESEEAWLKIGVAIVICIVLFICARIDQATSQHDIVGEVVYMEVERDTRCRRVDGRTKCSTTTYHWVIFDTQDKFDVGGSLYDDFKVGQRYQVREYGRVFHRYEIIESMGVPRSANDNRPTAPPEQPSLQQYPLQNALMVR